MFLFDKKIEKCHLGSSEVKKVFQGSNLIWENKSPYTFYFSQSSFFPPSYLDYRRLYHTEYPHDNVWENGFYKLSARIAAYRKSNTKSYYRAGKLVFKSAGQYRITVGGYNEAQSTTCGISAHVGNVNSVADMSAFPKIWEKKNSAATYTESFEINMTENEVLSFVGQISSNLSEPCIRTITIEPI